MTTWFSTTPRFNDPVGALRVAHFADQLSRFPVGHLVDLGAGHGAFARVAAGLGWRVTAVDARAERFANDARVTWVVSDVRDFDAYDDVDVVACLGLWYHLTLADQLALLERVAPRPFVLDTHVAMEHSADHGSHHGRVTDLVQVEGFTGRFYRETGLQQTPTASWGNDLSFWPTPASLERQAYDAGYDVFEQVRPVLSADRSFFVARMLAPAVRDRLDDAVAVVNLLTHPEAAPLPTGQLAPEATRAGTGVADAGGSKAAPAAPASAAATVLGSVRRTLGRVLRRTIRRVRRRLG